MANKYVLRGNGIQVDYTIGGNPGFTALTFTEGATNKTFTPAQITTDQTGLGTLVSVALVKTIVVVVPRAATGNLQTRLPVLDWV